MLDFSTHSFALEVSRARSRVRCPGRRDVTRRDYTDDHTHQYKRGRGICVALLTSLQCRAAAVVARQAIGSQCCAAHTHGCYDYLFSSPNSAAPPMWTPTPVKNLFRSGRTPDTVRSPPWPMVSIMSRACSAIIMRSHFRLTWHVLLCRGLGQCGSSERCIRRKD